MATPGAPSPVSFNPIELANKVLTTISKTAESVAKHNTDDVKKLADQVKKSNNKVKPLTIEGTYKRTGVRTLAPTNDNLALLKTLTRTLSHVATEESQKKIISENKKITTGIYSLREITKNTQKAYKDILKTVFTVNFKHLDDTFKKSLAPLKTVSKENTLKKVENALVGQRSFEKKVFTTIDHQYDITKNHTGLLTRIRDGIRTLIDTTRKQMGKLIKQSSYWEKMQKLLEFSERRKNTKRLREEVSRNVGVSDRVAFQLANLGNVIVPEDTLMRKITDGIARTASFFGGLGGFFGNAAWRGVEKFLPRKIGGEVVEAAVKPLQLIGKLFKGLGALTKLETWLAPLRLLNPATIVRFLPQAAKFLLTSTRFMGGIAALAASAVFLSLARSPELVGKYGEAFARIWSENIVPAFEWLKNLGGKLYDWWTSTGESSLADIGDFINKSLIWLIGNVIPETFTFIGRVISDGVDRIIKIGASVVDLVKQVGSSVMEIVNRIIGIFGIGPYGDKGIVTNIIGALDGVDDLLVGFVDKALALLVTSLTNTVGFLFNTFDSALTAIYNMIFGKTSDKTLMTQLSDYINSTWDGIVKSVNDFVANIYTTFTDSVTSVIDWVKDIHPFEFIKTKINDLVEAFVNMFPSVEDLKAYMRNMLDSTWIPSSVSDFFKEKLGLQDQSAQNNIKMATQPLTNTSSNLIIQQVDNSTTNNNNSSSGGGNFGRARGRPSTRPETSGYDIKLYGNQSWGNNR